MTETKKINAENCIFLENCNNFVINQEVKSKKEQPNLITNFLELFFKILIPVLN